MRAYLGDGLNRWSAVHRLNAARLHRLALEKLDADARYHPVVEEGVPVQDIAEAIGRGLKMPVVSKPPEEAAVHFGWIGAFIGLDLASSSAQTQERLGVAPDRAWADCRSRTSARLRQWPHINAKGR